MSDAPAIDPVEVDANAELIPGKKRMHVHLPRPLHGWREFFGEVGIIVIGVLIALAAEQMVEAAHWRQRVAEAESSMRVELGDDNGAQAVTRQRIAPCIDRMLTNVQQALLAERDRHVPFISPSIAPPPFRSWDSDAWRAADASGATSHIPAEEMSRWASPYDVIGDMESAATREQSDWADLTGLETVPAHPSDIERDRLIAAIAHARHDNAFLTLMSGTLLNYTREIGVAPSRAAVSSQMRGQLAALPGCAAGHA